MDKAKGSKEKHQDSVKTNKSQTKMIITVIVTAIIVFAIAAGVFVYYPKYTKSSAINEYKRTAYGVMICQYSCPLTQQTYQNQTQLLPDQSCAKDCTLPLEGKNYTGMFTMEDLQQSDGFVSDVGIVLTQCRKTAAINLSNITISLDNAKYFKCTADSLAGLKDKYTYLN